jgi:hypothetical protein
MDGETTLPGGIPTSRTIVLTSPSPQKVPLKPLLKDARSIVNLPWSLEEIELVRKVAYPELDSMQVAESFRQWGGIPRIILDYGNQPQRMSQLRVRFSQTTP